MRVMAIQMLLMTISFAMKVEEICADIKKLLWSSGVKSFFSMLEMEMQR